jgi:predicted transcriptional regulator
MEVHLSPEQEAELSELASRKGRDANTLAQEVLDFYLKHEARFVEAVKRGIASADRGDLIEHDEVLARIGRLTGS